jgi:hypothetical protein
MSIDGEKTTKVLDSLDKHALTYCQAKNEKKKNNLTQA